MTSYPQPSLLIGGEAITEREVSSAVLDPGTGEAIGRVPHATAADLDRALEAAARGFETCARCRRTNVHACCGGQPTWFVRGWTGSPPS